VPGSRVLPIAAAALVAAFGVTLLRAPDPAPPRVQSALSLLAVGDTGTRPGWLPALDGERAVGAGLGAEHRRARADALLLLGDNFYDHGLERQELLSRVLGNVVIPFCPFVELSGPRSEEVRGGCAADASAAPPPPIYAVLGNHDSYTKDSRRLQATAVSEFVSNWQLSAEPAKAIELGRGVSLILFDSSPLEVGGDSAPLREALRASRGPWRILAAHHPLGTSRDHGYKKEAGVGDYGARVRNAIVDAGVPVQLMLAGHEHSLQLIELGMPGPRLVVIAGGGSHPNPIKTRSRGRLFGYMGLGFARVDLIGEADAQRLVVTLFSAPRWRGWLGRPPEVLARWSVSVDGEVFGEPLSIEVIEPS
jgi:hypothetical protein